ncbi:hypothetical protein P261_00585 [Lachnospiraceae bacterium TWA4]|nr:hypothetical protein P261_00585 [Lachnospiraceae bacterium TWA4]
MGEIKPRSMRMSDENYSRLQELSDNRSLDDTISFLLKVYEKDEERNGLGTQNTKLDEFDELLQTLRSQYATSLHLLGTAKETVRGEFQEKFIKKEEMIHNLQEELASVQKKAFRKRWKTSGNLTKYTG